MSKTEMKHRNQVLAKDYSNHKPASENQMNVDIEIINTASTIEDTDSREDIVTVTVVDVTSNSTVKNKKKINLFKVLKFICIVGFVVFFTLFINEVFLQPWRADLVIHQTRDLHKPDTTLSVASAASLTAAVTEATNHTPELTPVATPDPSKNEEVQLLQFKDLLTANPDTKGWITYPDTNIDYAVMQRTSDPEYYLSHDFNGKKQKAGCLFLDPQSSVENNTKNLVIHGHNMKSTNNMFHSLEHMRKDIEYFKLHTLFRFDTLHQAGQWKVISVFITNGSDKKEPFFNYMQSIFKDSSEFMNFVYQLRIRSIYDLDQVDVNENDQLCTLSTCSYELDNYRLVIVARKIREGEGAFLDREQIKKSSDPLYPQSYYNNYGGKAPKLPANFKEALNQGMIHWYN